MFREEIQLIEALASTQALRTQNFNVVDAIQSIKLIGDHKLISRLKLSKILGLGEGSIRTLIKRMKTTNLIKTIRSGVYLTDQGKLLYDILRKYIKDEFEIPKDIAIRLTNQEHNYCLVVADLSDKIKKGIEERDIAIRFGANVLITLVHKYNKLFFPDGYEFNEEYKECSKYLFSKVQFKDGDLVIISGSDNERGARNGAYAAFYNLLRK